MSSRAACLTMAHAFGPVKIAVPAATPSGCSVVSCITRTGLRSEVRCSGSRWGREARSRGELDRLRAGAHEDRNIARCGRGISRCLPLASLVALNDRPLGEESDVRPAAGSRQNRVAAPRRAGFRERAPCTSSRGLGVVLAFSPSRVPSPPTRMVH